MAAVFRISPLVTSCNFRRFTPCQPKFVTACNSVIKSVDGTIEGSVLPEPVVRRSGNYKPCMWDNNFLQSLKSDYTDEQIIARASELKEEVRLMLNNVVEPLDQLELIDRLQRLGLGDHFQEEINGTLKKIQNGRIDDDRKDLHYTALEFRLLRQHGIFISPEGFKRFFGNGYFICPGADIKGMLSLYEASYFSIEGETLMEAALYFTSKSLKECLPNITDVDLQIQVRHALELPLQWRIPRFDARWNIELYERSSDMIPAVLEFAKLDFNISQGLYQEELKDLSRWDVNAIEELPYYMKICFLSFYNFVHETYYDILKEQDVDILSHQRKWWIELFKHQLVEARWYHGGHQPTMEEYLRNGLVSIAGPIGVLYSYICTEDPIKKEEVEFIEGLPDIVRLACEIFRLADDYGTSSVILNLSSSKL